MILILRSVVALGFVLLRVIRIFHPKIMCAWELMKSIACFSCYLGHVPTLDFTVMLGVCIVGGFGSSANVTLVFLWESDDVRFMTWLGYPRWFCHVKIFVLARGPDTFTTKTCKLFCYWDMLLCSQPSSYHFLSFSFRGPFVLYALIWLWICDVNMMEWLTR